MLESLQNDYKQLYSFFPTDYKKSNKGGYEVVVYKNYQRRSLPKVTLLVGVAWEKLPYIRGSYPRYSFQIKNRHKWKNVSIYKINLLLFLLQK